MKLYLHIGTEKTGTTTIQEVLFQNQNVLQQHGFHFLQCAGQKNNRALPSYCMEDDKFDDFFIERNIKTSEKKQEFKRQFKLELDLELKNLPTNVHSVIISSEHFHSRTQKKPEIQRVHQLLSDYFSEIIIICYLREQMETCVSLYSTAIKVGLITNINKMLEHCMPTNPYYNYYQLVSKWANIFGKEQCKVRLFTKERFFNGSLVDDFFYQINPELLEFITKDIEDQNSSLSPLGQFLGLAINKAFPKHVGNSDINTIRTRAIQAISQQFQGKGTHTPRKLYNKIYNAFTESNTRLNEEFLGGEGNCFSYSNAQSCDSIIVSEEKDLEGITRIFSTIAEGAKIEA